MDTSGTFRLSCLGFGEKEQKYRLTVEPVHRVVFDNAEIRKE